MSRSRHGLICAALCALGLLAGGAPVWSQQPQPVQHEYRIRHFKTEGGVELPEVRIVYGTYGHLDPAGDNAILLPSHYMAEMHGYAWLVGPGKALDPGKLFLITSELFGNGRSSSPSNTPEPFSGPRFPVMTIRDKVEPEKGIQAFSLVWTAWLFSQEWWRRELWRSDPSLGSTLPQVIDHFRKHFIPGADANNLILQMRTWESNVRAVHELLTKELHVHHLRAVIGFSMGAQQAFQWAVSYPDFMDRIVATSGTAKTYGHGIVRLESEITALTTDPTFAGGDYKVEPERGIQAFSLVWTAWLFSQEWWRRELWRSDPSLGSTLPQVIDHFRKHFIPGADANNLILQMRTWEATTSATRRRSVATWKPRCVPSRCRSCTCPPPPTCTFR